MGVAAANAADVRFFLAYGDAGFASANGAAMGDELKACSAIGGMGTSVTVQVWVQSTSAQTVNYAGGCMFVGFDTASTNNSTTGYTDRTAAETAGIDDKLGLDTAYSSLGSFHGTVADGTVGLQGTQRFRGAARSGSAATVRSIGLNQAIQFGTGNSMILAAGDKVRLADMIVRNRGIAQGDCYGDVAAENGLTLNSFSPASSGSNFMGSAAAGNPNADVKYSLAVVPEPTTVIAIGAGLVALAARRRKK